MKAENSKKFKHSILVCMFLFCICMVALTIDIYALQNTKLNIEGSLNFISHDYSLFPNLKFTFDDDTKTATVAAAKTSISGQIEVPSHVRKGTVVYIVNEVADDGFKDCSEMTSITLPETIKTISSGAFVNCTKLTDMAIPSSVESIEAHMNSGVEDGKKRVFFESAFLNTPYLQNSNGIYTCKDGKKILLRATTATVETPTDTTTTTFDLSNVYLIAGGAFSNCQKIENITIPNTVKYIGNFAFHGCSSLKQIEIPASLKLMYDNSFIMFDVEHLNEETQLDVITISSTSIKINATEWGLGVIFSNYSYISKVYVKSNASFVVDAGEEGVFNRTVPELLNNYLDGNEGDRYFKKATTSDKTGYDLYVRYTPGPVPVPIPDPSEDDFDPEPNIDEDFEESDERLVYIPYTSGVATVRPGKKSITDPLNDIVKYYYLDGARYKVTKIKSFNNCTNLINITIPDTIKTIYYYGLANIPNVTTLKFPLSIRTFSAYAMSGCTNLSSVSIPSTITYIGNNAFAGTAFKTNLTSNSKGIYTCYDDISKKIAISIPENASSVDLTNVYLIAGSAFTNCNNLTSVTIPSSVEFINTWAFKNCANLNTIILDSSCEIKENTFKSCSNLSVFYVKKGISVPEYVSNNFKKLDVSDKEGYDKYGKESYLAADWKAKICTNEGGNSSGFCTIDQITSIAFVNTIPSGNTNGPISVGANDENGSVPTSLNAGIIDVKAYAIKNSDTSYSIYFYSPVKIYLGNKGNNGVDSSGKLRAVVVGCQFYGLAQVTSFNFENLDTSNVTNMSNLFFNCSKVVELNLSTFDTSKVNSMGSMFCNCSSLTSLDLSTFDTSEVTGMSYMFNTCSRLTGLDLSSFDTSKVTSMSYMFAYCSSLTNLDLSTFDTSKVTNMGSMFFNCSGLTSLDLSTFDTSKVTSMSDMFTYCSSLTGLDLSTFDTSKVTNMGNMFYNCSSLTGLDLSTFDTSQVTNMDYMFTSCSGLTSLDLSTFDTSKVTSMLDMFGGCSSLTSLDLSTFDTSQVIDMYGMFVNCSSLTSLDLSTFDTSQVIDMGAMFANCSSLTSLDLSSFDTSKVMKMSSMFEGCASLTSLDLSSFDTSKVTDMSYMFEGCDSLTNLNISSFNMVAATYSDNIAGMLSGCSALEVLHAPYNVSTDITLPYLMYRSYNGSYNTDGYDTITSSNCSTMTGTPMVAIFTKELNNIGSTARKVTFDLNNGVDNINLWDGKNVTTDTETNTYYNITSNTLTFGSAATWGGSSVQNSANSLVIRMIDYSLDWSDPNKYYDPLLLGNPILNKTYSVTFTKSDTTKNHLLHIKMNTNAKDMGVDYSLSSLAYGTYTLSFQIDSFVLSSYNSSRFDQFTLSHFKLEQGSTATSYTPPVLTGYSGTNYSVIPEREGYTFGGWYTDFDATASKVVNYGRKYMYTDKLSLSLSVYRDNWANWSNINRIISCTEGGGWNIENNGEYICFTINVGTTPSNMVGSGNCSNVTGSGGYINFVSSIKFKELTSGWHTFAMAFDGTSLSFSIDDGWASGKATWSGTQTLQYNSTNAILVGAEAQDRTDNPANYTFVGKIGNVCISHSSTFPTEGFFSIPEQDVTYKAIWLPKTYKVTFDNQDGGNENIFDGTKLYCNDEYAATYNINTDTITFKDASTWSGNGYSGVAIQAFLDNSYAHKEIVAGLTAVGRYSATFTKDSTFNRLRIKVNGNAADSYLYYNISHFPNGATYTFSFDILSSKLGTATNPYENFTLGKFKLERGATATNYNPPCIYVTYGENYSQAIDLRVPSKDGLGVKYWQDSNGNKISSQTIVSIAKNHTLTPVWGQVSYLAADWKAKICTNSGGNSNGFCTIDKITSISFVNEIPTGYTNGPISVGANNTLDSVPEYLYDGITDVQAYAIKNSDTSYSVYFYSPAKIYLGNICHGSGSDLVNLAEGRQFAGLTNVSTFNFANLDTSKLFVMSAMFDSCYALKTLDLSSFDTSNVTTMQHMFWRCDHLTSINLSSFDTSKVNNMGTMFIHCQSLTELDLSSFVISNNIHMDSMFEDCPKLTTLTIASSNFTSGSYIPNCGNLTTVYVKSGVTAPSVVSDNFDKLDSSDKTGFDKYCKILKKGSLISMTLGGDYAAGLKDVYRVVKLNDDGTALVMAMFDAGSIVRSWTEIGVYDNINLDIYLNTTWYETLNDTAKKAIIQSNINVYYYGGEMNNNYLENLKYSSKSKQGETLTRNIFALDVEDVEEYFGGTTGENGTTEGVFTLENIFNFFWNTTSKSSWADAVWFRSTSGGFGTGWYVSAYDGKFYSTDGEFSISARPAFRIDLSKIDWSFYAG